MNTSSTLTNTGSHLDAQSISASFGHFSELLTSIGQRMHLMQAYERQLPTPSSSWLLTPQQAQTFKTIMSDPRLHHFFCYPKNVLELNNPTLQARFFNEHGRLSPLDQIFDFLNPIAAQWSQALEQLHTDAHVQTQAELIGKALCVPLKKNNAKGQDGLLFPLMEMAVSDDPNKGLFGWQNPLSQRIVAYERKYQYNLDAPQNSISTYIKTPFAHLKKIPFKDQKDSVVSSIPFLYQGIVLSGLAKKTLEPKKFLPTYQYVKYPTDWNSSSLRNQTFHEYYNSQASKEIRARPDFLKDYAHICAQNSISYALGSFWLNSVQQHLGQIQVSSVRSHLENTALLHQGAHLFALQMQSSWDSLKRLDQQDEQSIEKFLDQLPQIQNNRSAYLDQLSVSDLSALALQTLLWLSPMPKLQEIFNFSSSRGRYYLSAAPALNQIHKIQPQQYQNLQTFSSQLQSCSERIFNALHSYLIEQEHQWYQDHNYPTDIMVQPSKAHSEQSVPSPKSTEPSSDPVGFSAQQLQWLKDHPHLIDAQIDPFYKKGAQLFGIAEEDPEHLIQLVEHSFCENYGFTPFGGQNLLQFLKIDASTEQFFNTLTHQLLTTISSDQLENLESIIRFSANSINFIRTLDPSAQAEALDGWKTQLNCLTGISFFDVHGVFDPQIFLQNIHLRHSYCDPMDSSYPTLNNQTSWSPQLQRFMEHQQSKTEALPLLQQLYHQDRLDFAIFLQQHPKLEEHLILEDFTLFIPELKRQNLMRVSPNASKNSWIPTPSRPKDEECIAMAQQLSPAVRARILWSSRFNLIVRQHRHADQIIAYDTLIQAHAQTPIRLDHLYHIPSYNSLVLIEQLVQDPIGSKILPYLNTNRFNASDNMNQIIAEFKLQLQDKGITNAIWKQLIVLPKHQIRQFLSQYDIEPISTTFDPTPYSTPLRTVTPHQSKDHYRSLPHALSKEHISYLYQQTLLKQLPVSETLYVLSNINDNIEEILSDQLSKQTLKGKQSLEQFMREYDAKKRFTSAFLVGACTQIQKLTQQYASICTNPEHPLMQTFLNAKTPEEARLFLELSPLDRATQMARSKTLDQMNYISDHLSQMEFGFFQQQEQQYPQISFKRLYENSQLWHQEQAAQQADATSTSKKGKTVSWTPLIGMHQREDWTAVELTSAQDLFMEGKAMSHCVSSYSSSCKKGHSRIFAILLRNEKMSTLELRLRDENQTTLAFGAKNALEIPLNSQWHIVQNKGKHNADPQKAVHQFSQQFCAFINEQWTEQLTTLQQKAQQEKDKEAQKIKKRLKTRSVQIINPFDQPEQPQETSITPPI